MRKNLLDFFLCSLLLVILLPLLASGKAFSQFRYPVGSFKTEVTAAVGDFYLNLSGFISPFASVVLTSDGVFMRSAVADGSGNFFISQVLIGRSFSHFCLEAIDFRRIGDSITCFTFSPATGSITMKDIFLPPTLGLSKTEIAEGKSVIAFGFTMPGATVTLIFSNGQTLTTVADASGYYSFNINNLKAGKHELYAKAEYKNKESLTPTKKVELRSLSWWEQFLAFLKDLLNRVGKFFTSLSLGSLWLMLPILILIIILIFKLWPEKFSFISGGKLFATLPRDDEKLLHHWWWVGY